MGKTKWRSFTRAKDAMGRLLKAKARIEKKIEREEAELNSNPPQNKKKQEKIETDTPLTPSVDGESELLMIQRFREFQQWQRGWPRGRRGRSGGHNRGSRGRGRGPPRRKKRDMSQIQCCECGKWGHFARDCPNGSGHREFLRFKSLMNNPTHDFRQSKMMKKNHKVMSCFDFENFFENFLSPIFQLNNDFKLHPMTIMNMTENGQCGVMPCVDSGASACFFNDLKFFSKLASHS